jgi:UDP-N-acetylmuramoyl-tripeptide--D-alanyl-D-alanine ligase
MTINNIYQIFKQSAGISTDTRHIRENQIYAALKGANFDGNTMAKQAIEKGASFALIDNPDFQEGANYLLVDDVLHTLQQLALHHRKQAALKALIAVTGSNGKTTTKELLHAVLSTAYKTHYTKGNLNNHIGIPLTLLEMPLDTEIAVIEMGANHQKEIASYCKYVEPDWGVITNIGKAHLEGFGGIEGVKKGKGELFDYLKKHGGGVFYNADSDILKELIKEKAIAKTVSYGRHLNANYHAKILEEQPFLALQFENTPIKSHLFGSYNFDNIMCAIAVGKYFNVPEASIQNAIQDYIPSNKRSEVVIKDSNKIICDYYNANPTSMEHALESFAKIDAAAKIVILGDMFELGDFSLSEHQRIADWAQRLKFDTIVLVGEMFEQTQTSDKVLKFKNTETAKDWFVKQNFQNTEILLKGSRGMKMEHIMV